MRARPLISAVLITLTMGLSGCQMLLDMLSTDTVIDVSCAGDDTVVVGGRDLCKEFEEKGRIECDVGYKIRLDGQQVCP